jgi:hypothetical protein
MDRRIALKNMGLAMGFTVATPTLLSLLQSCQQEAGPSWTPTFFTEEEGGVLTQLVDIILPKTDTPSASEVSVHIFLDRYMNEVSEPQEQALMQMGFAALIKTALNQSGKESAKDLETEDLEPVLATALAKKTEEEETAMFEAMASYQEAMAKGEEATLDDAISSAAFANNLRSSTIWAYKKSEQIGENVLAYLPVPGEYVPCADLNELTGGKAWSI